MNRCPDLVVCLKRDLQCLRPEASLVLIYRPYVAGMKGRVDLAQPVKRTPDLWSSGIIWESFGTHTIRFQILIPHPETHTGLTFDAPARISSVARENENPDISDSGLPSRNTPEPHFFSSMTLRCGSCQNQSSEQLPLLEITTATRLGIDSKRLWMCSWGTANQAASTRCHGPHVFYRRKIRRASRPEKQFNLVIDEEPLDNASHVWSRIILLKYGCGPALKVRNDNWLQHLGDVALAV
ncbi:uncharacterized protein TNCV_5099841 [Trichonephila clavipes]|uniref:Uncharacterized protein n=1 Tax=Trichonephila clavipes TaxID=2585209 RepID=A0A8X6VBS4_TRICX|nr:uncharacterized protein TNCV_5099841 [Trichonephila clavipes]